jgi:hypothetical protein
MHRWLGCAVTAALVLLGTARADEKDELFDTELAIAKKRARMPADIADVERYLRPPAKKFEIAFEIEPAPPETTTRVPLPDGKPSPIELRRVDLRGTAGLGDVQLLFAIATTPFIYELESLRITPRPGNKVAFEARVAMARWAGEAPYVLGTYRDPASAMHGRLLELRAIMATIDALEKRSPPRHLLNAIGLFANAIGEKAIALTEMRAGQETRIDGVLLGTAARAALKPALETSGFDVAKLDFAPRGDCQAFTATLRLQQRDEEEENAWGGAMFDFDVASVCTPKPAPPPARVAARGNGGKVTLHLRGVDAADVFLALNAATNEGFVVDGGVNGRIDADFETATLEEALAAMPAANIAASPGPLHLVRPAGRPAATVPAGNYTGEPISMSIHDADLHDIVRALEEVGGRKLSPPPAARLSIFASEEPWDRLLAGMLALAGDAAKSQEPEEPPRRQWWAIKPNEISARDLKLAGVVSTADGWVGYAYTPGPSRKVVFLKANQPLLDAKVAAIDANGVTFDNGVKLDLR